MLQDEVNRLKTEIKKNQTLLKDPELKNLAQKEIDRLKTQLKTLEKTSVSISQNTLSTKSGSKKIIKTLIIVPLLLKFVPPLVATKQKSGPMIFFACILALLILLISKLKPLTT